MKAVYVMIDVSDDASTVTPTSMATTETEEESTSAPKGMATPSPPSTSTTIPVNTDTLVPTASEQALICPVYFSAFSQLFLGLVTAGISTISAFEITDGKVFRNRS